MTSSTSSSISLGMSTTFGGNSSGDGDDSLLSVSVSETSESNTQSTTSTFHKRVLNCEHNIQKQLHSKLEDHQQECLNTAHVGTTTTTATTNNTTNTDTNLGDGILECHKNENNPKDGATKTVGISKKENDADGDDDVGDTTALDDDHSPAAVGDNYKAVDDDGGDDDDDGDDATTDNSIPFHQIEIRTNGTNHQLIGQDDTVTNDMDTKVVNGENVSTSQFVEFNTNDKAKIDNNNHNKVHQDHADNKFDNDDSKDWHESKARNTPLQNRFQTFERQFKRLHREQQRQITGQGSVQTDSVITNPSTIDQSNMDAMIPSNDKKGTVEEDVDNDPNEELVLALIIKTLPDLVAELQGQLDPRVWLYQVGLLGNNSAQTIDIPLNIEEWWEKIYQAFKTEATLSGNPVIQKLIGEFHLRGTGVPINDKLGFHWYQLAADQGNAQAQHNLGVMYANARGVTQDYTKAVRYYQLAANQGNASAQTNLGSMYHDGHGVSQDDAKAVEYFRLAAIQGNAQAQCNLGIMHAKGQGVQQDFTKAVEYFQLAANQGDAQAQYNVAISYHIGQGVLQDDAKAVEYFQLAASQGIAKAQYNLGVMYHDGQGVSQDDAKAVEYYELAANQGLAEAQFNLGSMYVVGKGIGSDVMTGLAWLHKSADQGHGKAQEFLELFESMLTLKKTVRHDSFYAYELLKKINQWVTFPPPRLDLVSVVLFFSFVSLLGGFHYILITNRAKNKQ